MFRPFVRAFAFVWKELLEIVRQPSLILVLVLGPFFILFIFGIGHQPQQPPLSTVLVLPADIDNVPRDLEYWRDRFMPSAEIVEITDDEQRARAEVQNFQRDLALIVPPNVYQKLEQHEQTTIAVVHDEIDPLQRTYINYASYVVTSELNKQVIMEIVRTAQDRSEPLPNSAELRSIPPQLVAEPFTRNVESVARIEPSFVAFYSPGVLALLLQHMAVTFAALSLIRERLLGTMELYRVSPASTFSVLIGKFVSYALVSAIVAGVLTAAITQLLEVPFLGDPRYYWGTIALLVFASLGIGLTISLISASQEQAVQLAMLLLLAAVFFSGFVLSIDTLRMPATIVSYVLPVTYGIIALQDLMLRGTLQTTQPIIALGIIAGVFVILSAVLLRSQLNQR